MTPTLDYPFCIGQIEQNELIESIPSDRLLIETDDCVASKEVSAQIQKAQYYGLAHSALSLQPLSILFKEQVGISVVVN